MNRRDFIRTGVAGLALAGIPAVLSGDRERGWCRAIAFDGFPIFDPRPVFSLTEELFPGRGNELSALWRSRQFEYTWLRTLTGRYADFPSVTRDALLFATKSLKLELKPDQQERLLGSYFQLKAWPDVLPAVRQLREAGIKLGFLSNFSGEMLAANITNSGLDGYFDELLSTDRVRAFKPDPRAYQMGIDVFKLKRDQLVFAAFAGWDAAGAKSFGYPTFWVNRQNAIEEELDSHPDGSGTLSDLVKFVNA